jgi:peptide/nickel transport system permease protein
MRYLVRRIGFYLLALWASITINFFLPRLIPGDAAQAMIARMGGGSGATQSFLQALRAELGVDTTTPLLIQYWKYLVNLLHGDLGYSSYFFPSKVTTVIGNALWWTIGLVGIAVILSFLVGTLIGIIVAWKRGTWLDNIVPPALMFLSSIPYFWMALAIVFFVGTYFSGFPTDNGYDIYNATPGFNMDFILSVIQHGLLPVLTLLIGALAGWVLPMRNTMVTTLSEDYVLMAQAKGLSERRVMFFYAARNAILPSITSFSMSLGLVVGGSLLTEIVFNYPGIGFALYQAVEGHDYTVVQGCFLLIAITVLIANFLSDLVYTLLDPRVRQGKG